MNALYATQLLWRVHINNNIQCIERKQTVILHRVRRFPYTFCISLSCQPKLYIQNYMKYLVHRNRAQMALPIYVSFAFNSWLNTISSKKYAVTFYLKIYSGSFCSLRNRAKLITSFFLNYVWWYMRIFLMLLIEKFTLAFFGETSLRFVFYYPVIFQNSDTFRRTDGIK